MEPVLNQSRKGLDAFWLKIIAIVGMTLDHIGIVLGGYMPFWAQCALYALGGLTFPIMAFLLCEGFRHTKNVKKYMLRLLGFAVITQIPYQWALMKQLNVLFTLLLGLLAIYLTSKIKSPLASGLIIVGFTAVTIVCDWGLIGVPMVLLYYYVKNRRAKLVLPILLPMALIGTGSVVALLYGQLFVLPQLLYVLIGCTLTIPLLASYNGQRGRPMRYFFYAYYPAHIAVLGLVRGLAFGNWGSL